MKKTDETKSTLKAYRAPKLVVYGDVRVVTQTLGNGAVNDTKAAKSM